MINLLVKNQITTASNINSKNSQGHKASVIDLQSKKISTNLKHMPAYYSAISFSARNPKYPSRATMRYLAEARKNHYMGSLEQLDMAKMSDICAGIDIFKGWTALDFKAFAKYTDTFELQRGCVHQCSHCGACAPQKIQTMSYPNFEKLVDGMSKMIDRLGFTPFDKSFYYPFDSSDPMIYTSKDKDGNKKNIFDAAKLFREKTAKRFHITTAGWNSPYAQEAAKRMVEEPRLINGFHISVSPFHRFMRNSIEAKRNGNEEQAKFWREKYIGMICNAMKTTNKLSAPRCVILMQYNPPGISESAAKERFRIDKFDIKDYNPGVSQDLFLEILKRLKKESVPIEYWANNNFSLSSNVEIRSISAIGRAANDYNAGSATEHFISAEEALQKRGALAVAPDGRIWTSRNDLSGIFHREVEPINNVYLEKSLNFDNN